MYKRWCDSILLWLSLLFLIVAFVASIRGLTEFSIKTLLNTDGLTILGITVAFFMNLSLKIPILKKVCLFVFLHLNFKNFDYKIQLEYTTNDNIGIDDVFNYFQETIERSKCYNSCKYNTYTKNDFYIKIYHRGMAANVMFKNITEIRNDNNSTVWRLEIDGVSKFATLNGNIRYIIDHFIDDDSVEKHFKHMLLEIDMGNTDINIAEVGGWINRKKYPVILSEIEVSVKESSYVRKNNDGICLMAHTKGAFNEGFELLKLILIS